MSNTVIIEDARLAGGPVLQAPATYYSTYTNGILNQVDPITLMLMAVVVVMFLGFGTFLGTSPKPPAYDAGSEGTGTFEVLIWGMAIFLIVTNLVQYGGGYDIAAGIKNLFAPVPELTIAVSPSGNDDIGAGGSDGDDGSDDDTSGVPEITLAKQVFHIPGNEYTYGEADALCNAYGARLATYDEIEDAYGAGAEWCSYGWSADQQALFPTQKSTYDALQKMPGHEHDCGRQGINGGYIANRKVRFGVNCYGDKPKITAKEQKAMQTQSVYPLTHDQIVLDKRTARYKAKLGEIQVSPFNGQTWSRV